MNRQQLIEFLNLSKAIEDYFEGDYRGDEEYRQFFDDSCGERRFEYDIESLIEKLFIADAQNTDPWEDDDFEYKLMIAYANRCGFPIMGRNNADIWEDISKLLALEAMRKHEFYQSREPIKTNGNNIRTETLKRLSLFSHIRNLVPNTTSMNTRSPNKAVYDVLSTEAESDATGRIVMKPNHPDNSVLQTAIDGHWDSFTEADRFYWGWVTQADEHIHLRKIAFRYARLDKSWNSIRKSFQ